MSLFNAAATVNEARFRHAMRKIARKQKPKRVSRRQARKQEQRLAETAEMMAAFLEVLDGKR